MSFRLLAWCWLERDSKLTIAIFNSAHAQSPWKNKPCTFGSYQTKFQSALQETDDVLSVTSLNLNIQLAGPANLVPENFAEVYNNTSLCTLRYWIKNFISSLWAVKSSVADWSFNAFLDSVNSEFEAIKTHSGLSPKVFLITYSEPYQ